MVRRGQLDSLVGLVWVRLAWVWLGLGFGYLWVLVCLGCFWFGLGFGWLGLFGLFARLFVFLFPLEMFNLAYGMAAMVGLVLGISCACVQNLL